MDFAVDAQLPFARQRVFRTFRDQMDALVPFLPQVAAITCTERSEQGEWVQTAWRFEANANVPAVLRSLLGDALFTWTDHARWSEAHWLCDWHTESRALRGAIACRARDVFESDGQGGTWVRIRGALQVDSERLSLPSPLRTPMAHKLERYLAHKLEGDVRGTLEALGRWLTDTASSS